MNYESSDCIAKNLNFNSLFVWFDSPGVKIGFCFYASDIILKIHNRFDWWQTWNGPLHFGGINPWFEIISLDWNRSDRKLFRLPDINYKSVSFTKWDGVRKTQRTSCFIPRWSTRSSGHCLDSTDFLFLNQRWMVLSRNSANFIGFHWLAMVNACPTAVTRVL